VKHCNKKLDVIEILPWCADIVIFSGMSCIELQQLRTTGGPLGAPPISRVFRLHCKGRELLPLNFSFYCGVFQALWMPGSQTEIAVVADSFVKVSVFS